MNDNNQEKQRIKNLMARHELGMPAAPRNEWAKIDEALEARSRVLLGSWKFFVPALALVLVVIGAVRLLPVSTVETPAAAELTQLDLEILFEETAMYADWSGSDPFAIDSGGF